MIRLDLTRHCYRVEGQGYLAHFSNLATAVESAIFHWHTRPEIYLPGQQTPLRGAEITKLWGTLCQ